MISKHVILRMDTVQELDKRKVDGQTMDGVVKTLLKQVA